MKARFRGVEALAEAVAGGYVNERGRHARRGESDEWRRKKAAFG